MTENYSIKAQIDASGVRSGINDIKGDLSGLDAHASKVGSAIGNALKTGVLAAGVAITAGLGGATKAFGDYEQGVANLNKIMGGTPDVQKEVADGMRELSTQSGTAVTSLLDVGASLSALGIGSGDVVKATKVVDQMGIALGLSNDSAASYLAGMNTLYGTSVDKWSNLASGINEVENSTSATAGGMLNFANEFAPIAKLFNITDKEALAFGATMESLKLAPAEAATSLKSAVTVALADDKKMTAWAKLLKTDVAGVKKALNEDLIGTLLKSASALDGMTSSSKAATVDAIWGSYGLKSMALIGDATKSYTNNLNTLNQGFEANVSIGREVETRNNTLYGSWNKVKTGITDIGISIGEVTSGPLKRLMDAFVAIRPAIGDFMKELLNGDWSAIEERFSGLRETIDKTFKGIGEGAGLALVAAGFVSLSGTVVKSLSTITAANVATWAKTKALAVTNAVTMAATVISNYARMAAVSVGSLITMTARSAGQWAAQQALALRGAAVMAGGVIGSFGLMLSGALASLGGMLTRNAFVWGQMVTQSLLSSGAMVTGVLSKYALMVAGVAVSMATVVATTIGGFASIVSSIAAPVALIITGLAAIGYSLDPGKFTIFGGIVSDTFNGLKSVISDCWAALQAGDFSGVANRLKTAMQDAWNYAKGINWRGLGGEIITMIGDGIEGILKTAADIGGWIYKQGSDWVASGGPRTLGNNIADGIGNAIKSVLAGDFDFWGAVRSAFNAVTSWLSLGWEIAKGIGQGLLDRITAAIAPVANSMLQKLMVAALGIQEAFAKAWNTILVGAANLVTGVIGAFSGIGSKIAGYLKPVTDKIDSILAKISAIGSSSTASGGYGQPQMYLSDTGLRVPANQVDAYRASKGGKASLTPYYGSVESNPKAQEAKGTGLISAPLPPGFNVNNIRWAGYETGGRGFTSNELKAGSGGTVQMVTVKGDKVTMSGAEQVYREVYDNWVGPFTADYVTNKEEVSTAFANNLIPISDNIRSSSQTASNNTVQSSVVAAKTQTTSGYDFKSFVDQSKANFLNGVIVGSDTVKASGYDFKSFVDQSKANFLNGVTTGAATQVQASGYAATALRLGAEIGAKFTTDGGNAVRLGGIDGKTAIIGGMNQGAAIGINAANQQASVGLSTANQQGMIGTTAASVAGSTTTSAASTASNTLVSGATTAASQFATGVGSATGGLAAFMSSLVPGSMTGYSGGGGRKGGAGTVTSSSGTNNFNDCFFEGFTDSCTGTLVNPLIYTNPQGVTSYINPMNYNDNGGISKYIGATQSGNTGNVYKAPIFAARGADIKAPTLAWLGEKGEEMVLPSDITAEIKGMIGDRKGGHGQPAVIKLYMNSRMVGEAFVSDLRQSGSMSVR